MKRMVVLASVCALVAACSDDSTADADGDGTISGEEIAEAAKQSDIKPEAGLYSVSSELLTIDMPGAPKGMAEMMKSGMNQQDREFCMSQEDADKGFEEMAKQSQDGNCEMKSFDIDGGDVDAQMVCKGEGQNGMSITMDGSGTSTTMDMTITMEGELPQIGKTKMVVMTKQKRIGDCPA